LLNIRGEHSLGRGHSWREDNIKHDYWQVGTSDRPEMLSGWASSGPVADLCGLGQWKVGVIGGRGVVVAYT